MVTKHFFKVLTIFATMIVLGLTVLFAVNYFGDKDKDAQAVDKSDQPQVAK